RLLPDDQHALPVQPDAAVSAAVGTHLRRASLRRSVDRPRLREAAGLDALRARLRRRGVVYLRDARWLSAQAPGTGYRVRRDRRSSAGGRGQRRRRLVERAGARRREPPRDSRPAGRARFSCRRDAGAAGARPDAHAAADASRFVRPAALMPGIDVRIQAMPAVPIVRSVQDVVDSLKIARGRPRDDEWGGVTFLVGAGCSRGAGIPLADAIARELVVDLAHSLSDTQTFAEADAALQWLKANGKLAQDLPWPRVYGQIFEDYYKDAPTQQRILARFVDAATGINWAHACLGELVRAHLVNTVVTTNFDQLVLDGMIRSDILPTIADGIRALDRIEGQPGYPQLIHIHGSRRTYQLRNSVTATTDYAASHPVVRAISELLRSTPALVVVGYAGAEEGIMAALLDAARNASPCPPIYWILYSD